MSGNICTGCGRGRAKRERWFWNDSTATPPIVFCPRCVRDRLLAAERDQAAITRLEADLAKTRIAHAELVTAARAWKASSGNDVDWQVQDAAAAALDDAIKRLDGGAP